MDELDALAILAAHDGYNPHTRTTAMDATGLRIESYPSIYNIGHRAIEDLLRDPVVVEEKVDGSQFSFGMKNGELHCRSKGKQLVIDAPEKMFEKAVATAKALTDKLNDGWTYRGEYLQSPKHNTLAYSRVPSQHIILFDIQEGPEYYLSPAEKAVEAARLGLEIVPVMYEGMLESFDSFRDLLERESVLGGVKIEGVVVKNYARFTEDKKAMMGKFVSEAFKETHRGEWKRTNPATGDIVQSLIESYRTVPRYYKAVQHLRERGELTGTPKDIGALLKEIGTDVHRECQDEIKERLFAYAWPKIQRGITAGLPQWYKEELAKQAFALAEDAAA